VFSGRVAVEAFVCVSRAVGLVASRKQPGCDVTSGTRPSLSARSLSHPDDVCVCRALLDDIDRHLAVLGLDSPILDRLVVVMVGGRLNRQPG
jgi:hypothetical protein